MNLFFETNKIPADKQKLRGGYYTPQKLAQFLVDWGFDHNTKRVLEPSCGDGNFVLEVLKKAKQSLSNECEVCAVELDADESVAAQQRMYECFAEPSDNVEWLIGDFFSKFEYLQQNPFDLIVGNPPFIRFQNIDAGKRDLAFLHLKKFGYRPTKLANIWSAFVQLSIELLKPGGRLAMVVPAELLQVNYAQELRKALTKKFDRAAIVGFKKLVFPEIQQEVVLLLCEGKRIIPQDEPKVFSVEFEDGNHLLENLDLSGLTLQIPVKFQQEKLKWTSLFIGNASFEAINEARQAKGLVALGQLASVDIGLVTGRNSFFVMEHERVKSLELKDFTLPIIGKTNALKSIVYDKDDFDAYKVKNPAYLLNLKGVSDAAFSDNLLKYLRFGEKDNIHTGYKCSIRKRWFDVPSVYVPDGFLFRQIHKYPLLVLNRAGITSTDTIHRVRFKENVNGLLLSCCFFNSLTLACAELGGRSYGGGVLELEPHETEHLLIPYDSQISIDIQKVDALIRSNRPDEALDYVDSIVLKGWLGFDDALVKKIRIGWLELRNRRINRK